MKTFFVTILVSSICLSNLFGQINDSKETEQITYNSGSTKKESAPLTKQQSKAKPEYEKGYELVSNGDFKKATKALKKAIDIDPTGNCGTGRNGMAYSELGYTYSRMGDLENAMTYLNKAIEINKYLPEAYLNKCVVFMQAQRQDLALSELEKLIKYNPDYAMGYAQRGFIYSMSENYDQALKDFNKFLDLVKDPEQAQSSQGLVEEVKKKIKEIEKKKNE